MAGNFVCESWKDYELIDCGGGEKLERFGDYVLIRPEAQAPMAKTYSTVEWKKMAHARFVQTGPKTGEWKKLKTMVTPWQISFPLGDQEIKFELDLTKFKHIGIFPEQAINWSFIYDHLSKFPPQEAKVLNLFAYTGAASLSARMAQAQVTHVDSIKQVVQWGKKNMKLSGLDEIRWIIDDALKFAQKEVRRGTKYDGIIMDPPSWGRGPKGEIWKFDKEIEKLIETCAKIIKPGAFIVLNTYSGFSKDEMSKILSRYLKNSKIQIGILYLSAESGNRYATGLLNRIIH